MPGENSSTGNPKVSICVPCYNSEKYLTETIACLCSQTYPNIEIILVNDGSTDGTASLLSAIADPKVTVLNKQNGGAAKARNLAYEKADGEYIIFFDSDDYIDAGFVAKQVSKINNRDKVVVLSAWGRFYNTDRNETKPVEMPHSDISFADWINTYWYHCNPMTNPGRALIPKKLIQLAGGWNEQLSLNDDLEFFTRVFLKAEKIVFNHDALFYYRSGINGLSAKIGNTAYKSLFNSIRLSVNLVFERYKQDKQIMKSCANMLQSFIYLTYPDQNNLRHMAHQEIKKLVPPDFKFQASGYTKLAVALFGWKLVKKVKSLMGA